MRVSHCAKVLFFLSVNGGVYASPTSGTTATLSARNSASTACGDIVNNEDTVIFNASLAFECLTSVPFNPAVASRFISYYNDTLQFQSTLTYLKNPPTSYQQPAVDLLAGLKRIQTAIDEGIFSNQYEFESTLQTLIYAAHDGHVDMLAGALSAFSFASPRDVVSLSLDGQKIPKIYLADDLFDSEFFTTFQPSAIKSINGKDATTYLSDFASVNSAGTLEAHADWNQLMLSAAQDIQGFFNVFSGGATFYPGDNITFVLENGTSWTEKFLAVYDSDGPTGPLQTGGDFYNFFVLGFYPASYDPDDSEDDSGDDSSDDSFIVSATPSATAAVSSINPTPTGWDNAAYPEIPDVAQEDLGTFGDGVVSGYFLESTSVSVLSIPSFDVDGDAVFSFQQTITKFINQTKAAGLKKVVIDLQQNYGGQSLLAIDTFKQFFPNIDPFAGSRMRAHASADVLGKTLTPYWDSLAEDDETKYVLAADEWVVTDRINADTNRNFTNWGEFFGPNLYNGDNFTNIERYNLSNAIFDASGTGLDVSDDSFAVYGYDANPAPSGAQPPFAAEDIIILSDGICHSSCALLMELFRHEAGVKVVAVGGTPTTGPMQAPAGSRGARDYDTFTLDANIDFTQQLLQNQSSPDATFLPNRTEQLSVFVYYADINLRDQVRKNEEIPLQFAYEAADCRIYYTPQTVYNYTNLWQYAADAIWKNSSLCVKDSTGYSSTSQSLPNFVGPSGSPKTPTNITNYLSSLTTSPIANFILQALNNGLPDVNEGASRNAPASTKVIKCTKDADCRGGKLCVNAPSCLGGGAVSQCLSRCPAAGRLCSSTKTKCTAHSTNGKLGNQNIYHNICPPAGSLAKCGSKNQLSTVNLNQCADCSK
ncbi:9d2e7923-2f4f-4e57-b298-0044821c9a72 [Sclerotinia trifoliorum]|uniref:9d2e7923-2f4f-4e57-b298-0044821c9a72 n=1 Tax=Sclerotinia trifoliorum TaxID=28548 RepID=A0A8H2VR35_9HELO|nr:9d2e7923-2f4f-4e57-b298-0044821c9a72 [Sclerotinia trifoliorum]